MSLFQGKSRPMQHFFNSIKTAAELRHAGWSSANITRTSRKGTIFRINRSAYVEVSTWNSWDARSQCLARHVAFMKTRRRYVLSHISAALWWGAPVLRLPQKIWVSHPSSTVRSGGDVRVSRDRGKVCSEAFFHQGAFLTGPLQTAVDCALTLPVVDALCIADYFLHRGVMGVAEFEQELTVMSCNGIRNAREVARLMSGHAESPAETVTRYRIKMWGFVDPQEQVTVRVNGFAYRPDFVWEKERVILEVDGGVKYSGAYGDPAQVIRQEKRRHRDLEKLGYRVVRVLWEDVVHTPENLRALLVNAGVPQREPTM